MAGWVHGIIPSAFDVSQHLAYFTDLENVRQRNESLYATRLAEARANLAAAARAGLPLNKTEDEDKQRIEDALGFLLQVANAERTKEIKVLQNYKHELYEKFKDNSKVVSFLNRLNIPQDVSDTSNLDDFYTYLTACIDEIRSTQERAKVRLEKLKAHIDQAKNTNNPLHYADKNTLAFRLGSDIQSIIYRMNGEISRVEKKSYTEALYRGTLKAITSSEVIQQAIRQAGNAADIANIITAIATDIANQAQKRLDEQQKTDFTELLNGEMDKIVDAYAQAREDSLTELQKMFLKNDTELIKEIEQSGATTLGIKIETEKKKLEQMQIRQNARGGKTVAKEFRALLKKIGVQEDILEQLPRITVSHSTNIHGAINEYIPTITEELTRKIRGSAGADIINIDLGDIELSFEQKQNANRILKQMSETITDIANSTSKKDVQDTQAFLKERNAYLESLEQQLNEVINSQNSNDITKKQFFIYHDSLKLYRTAESNTDFKGFSGRELNIIWALNELYSLGAPGLPADQDKMYTIAINLASNTLGSQNLIPLETIFSTFAGILMFDDVVTMAKDAAAVLQNSGTSQVIHMYSLNGVYVPASMILTYTYYSLTKGWEDSIQKGAKAHINTAGAAKIVSEHVNQLQQGTNQFPHYSGVWRSLAEKIAAETTVKIEFFSAFIDFIGKLSAVFS